MTTNDQKAGRSGIPLPSVPYAAVMCGHQTYGLPRVLQLACHHCKARGMMYQGYSSADTAFVWPSVVAFQGDGSQS